jgi:hypothetical protein
MAPTSQSSIFANLSNFQHIIDTYSCGSTKKPPRLVVFPFKTIQGMIIQISVEAECLTGLSFIM